MRHQPRVPWYLAMDGVPLKATLRLMKQQLPSSVAILRMATDEGSRVSMGFNADFNADPFPFLLRSKLDELTRRAKQKMG
jgi:hypothetical protein